MNSSGVKCICPKKKKRNSMKSNIVILDEIFFIIYIFYSILHLLTKKKKTLTLLSHSLSRTLSLQLCVFQRKTNSLLISRENFGEWRVNVENGWCWLVKTTNIDRPKTPSIKPSSQTHQNPTISFFKLSLHCRCVF